MKGIWGSSVAAFLVMASSGAFAADLSVKAPYMAPIPIYNWTGFYIGGNLVECFLELNHITGSMEMCLFLIKRHFPA